MSVATIVRPELVITSLADLALQKARKAEFVVKIGTPPASLGTEGQSAGVTQRLKDRLFKISESQLLPFKAKLTEMLMLSHITRAGLEEFGLNMRPNPEEAGLVFGVRKPAPDLRLYTIEGSRLSVNGNGVLRPETNGHSLSNGSSGKKNGYHPVERGFPFELVYISGEVIGGLADKIYETGSKGMDLAVLCAISGLAEDRARSLRESSEGRNGLVRNHFEEVKVLDLPPDSAKLLHRYARQTRKAQMYANKAL